MRTDKKRRVALTAFAATLTPFTLAALLPEGVPGASWTAHAQESVPTATAGSPNAPVGAVKVNAPEACFDGDRDQCVVLAQTCGKPPNFDPQCLKTTNVGCWRDMVIALDQIRTGEAIGSDMDQGIAKSQLQSVIARCKAAPIDGGGRPFEGPSPGPSQAPRVGSPKKFSFHADQNNSPLDAGRHAITDMTVSAGGRVDVIVDVTNHVALAGYCFRSDYFFRDIAGNIIYSVNAPQLCVDGKLVPFTSNYKRRVHWIIQLPPEVQRQVDSVVISHGPGHKDPIELLKNSVSKGIGIFKLFGGG